MSIVAAEFAIVQKLIVNGKVIGETNMTMNEVYASIEKRGNKPLYPEPISFGGSRAGFCYNTGISKI